MQNHFPLRFRQHPLALSFSGVLFSAGDFAAVLWPPNIHAIGGGSTPVELQRLRGYDGPAGGKPHSK